MKIIKQLLGRSRRSSSSEIHDNEGPEHQEDDSSALEVLLPLSNSPTNSFHFDTPPSPSSLSNSVAASVKEMYTVAKRKSLIFVKRTRSEGSLSFNHNRPESDTPIENGSGSLLRRINNRNNVNDKLKDLTEVVAKNKATVDQLSESLNTKIKGIERKGKNLSKTVSSLGAKCRKCILTEKQKIYSKFLSLSNRLDKMDSNIHQKLNELNTSRIELTSRMAVAEKFNLSLPSNAQPLDQKISPVAEIILIGLTVCVFVVMLTVYIVRRKYRNSIRFRNQDYRI